MPSVTEALLEKLIETYHVKKMLTLFHVEETVYPFPGIYPKESRSLIEQKLHENNFSVLECFQKVPAKQIIDGKKFRHCFENINSPL
jgi:molybdopterin-guanine dinucleotide biosynthesis protein A